MFESISGTKVAVETEPARVRHKDVMQVCGDSKKIREATGWYPEVSLSQTITALLDYWRPRIGSALNT
jgi:GDP-4-dehydro-6-deoxy-D-mannose reductase